MGHPVTNDSISPADMLPGFSIEHYINTISTYMHQDPLLLQKNPAPPQKKNPCLLLNKEPP